MSDNKDAINDILKELDRQKEALSEPPASEPESEPGQEDAENLSVPEPSQPEPDVQVYSAPTHDAESDAQEHIEEENEHGSELSDHEEPRYYQQGQPPQQRRPVHHKKKHKKKRQSNRLPGVLILTTLIFGVSIILSLVIIGFGKDMLGIGKSEQTQLFVVPEEVSTEELSILLQQEGVIRSPKAFQLFSRLRKSDTAYVAGQHFIRPNMAYEAIIDELTKVPGQEKGESVEVTFPEGITLLDAANLLEENHICDAKDFIFYFNSGGYGFDFEEELPLDTSIKFYRMEGYLFPDTYFFYENSDPEEVCQKIYFNFNEKMTPERMKKMKDCNLSLDQLITFASIVQKEAPTSDVMTMVASVFWNRLEHKDEYPRLESDPTSNYANDVIRPNMEYFDETFVNAYDTYKSAGLPPGAICNPGIEAIDAVLEHYHSDYYYFAANINTKETLFAETNEQHEENLAIIDEQYRQAAEEAAAAEE